MASSWHNFAIPARTLKAEAYSVLRRESSRLSRQAMGLKAGTDDSPAPPPHRQTPQSQRSRQTPQGCSWRWARRQTPAGASLPRGPRASRVPPCAPGQRKLSGLLRASKPCRFRAERPPKGHFLAHRRMAVCTLANLTAPADSQRADAGRRRQG